MKVWLENHFNKNTLYFVQRRYFDLKTLNLNIERNQYVWINRLLSICFPIFNPFAPEAPQCSLVLPTFFKFQPRSFFSIPSISIVQVLQDLILVSFLTDWKAGWLTDWLNIVNINCTNAKLVFNKDEHELICYRNQTHKLCSFRKDYNLCILQILSELVKLLHTKEAFYQTMVDNYFAVFVQVEEIYQKISSNKESFTIHQHMIFCFSKFRKVEW